MNNSNDINHNPLLTAFLSAQAKGLKKPTLRFANLTFKLAPSSGNNPNCIYVADKNGTYLGKIVPLGIFYKVGHIYDLDTLSINAVTSNPLDAARIYGKATGACSCCGRTLTNHASIALSIGPICAGKFGFTITEHPANPLPTL